MSLPTQIRKDVERSNEVQEDYIKQVSAEPAPDEEVTDEEQQPDAENVEEATTVEVQEASEQDESEEVVEEQPAEVENKEDSIDYWKQKFKVLEGKYKKEVPEVAQQNRDLRSQVSNVEQLLANLNTAQETQATDIEEKAYLTKEEIDDYGPDLIAIMKKAAQEVLSGEIDSLRADFGQLRQTLGKVSTTAQESARDTLLRSLTSEVPGWKEQNTDPDFIAWLGQLDLYSGLVRQQLLTEAFESNNTERVIAIFKGYQAEHAGEQKGAQTTVPEGGKAKATPQPQVNMDTLVAPGKSQPAGSSGAQGEGQFFTQAEIAAFYRDVQAGKYKGKDKERLEIEKAIFSAVNENRIRF
jgi:hypothetical protein